MHTQVKVRVHRQGRRNVLEFNLGDDYWNCSIQGYLIFSLKDIEKKSKFLQNLIKGRFFSESMLHFSHGLKNVPKLSWKRDFEIVLCLESADSNCTAVTKGGKIQNTKLRIERSTFFGQ